ncbi:MAG: 3-dehydroquinate synthase, partial [Chloroflexi bacterium]|nr:3-dehydroquinate synthase [Chloroflexota bacterium]
MSLDKKIQDGSKRWVMLEDVGRPVIRNDVPEELVEKTVRKLVS